MKPTINLATHGHLNRRAVLAVYVACCAVLVLLLIFNLSYWSSSHDQLSRVEAHVAELKGQLGIDSATQPVSDAEFNAQLKMIRFSNQVIARDSYRWTELLGQLEQVTLNNIRITSIHPLYKEERIALKGEARRVEDLQDFLNTLEESPFFYDILLLSQAEQELSTDGSKSNVIAFSLKVGGKKG